MIMDEIIQYAICNVSNLAQCPIFVSIPIACDNFAESSFT